MSAKLNNLMADYLNAFGEYPTIIGLPGPEAERQMSEALSTGVKMLDAPRPEDTPSTVEI